MYQIKNSSGNWVDGVPEQGDLYRMVLNGATAESVWASPQSATKITQLAFLSRFTDDEGVDIDLASIGNTREAALLRRYLQKVAAASHIDLSRVDLAEDLQKLVEFNLLTPERKQTILTAPVQDHEVFKG
jgi:hypothetical protein